MKAVITPSMKNIKELTVQRKIGTKVKDIYLQKVRTFLHIKWKQPCKKTCCLQCHTKYTQDQRLQIHNSFLNLGDITKQCTFMVNSMTNIQPTQKSIHKRANNFYLTANDRKVKSLQNILLEYFRSKREVCLYSMGQVVQTIVASTVIAEKERGYITRDSQSRKILPCNRKSLLMYSNTKTIFRWELIDFSNVPAVYSKKCSTANEVRAKEHTYKRVLNNELNLGFFTPKKDQSVVCMQYNNASHEKKVHLEGTYQNHIKNKQTSREMKRADVEMALKNSQIRVCDFHLQSVLQAPCSELSDIHRQNDGDSMHFCIKKSKTKRAQKIGPVYVPSQWTGIVQHSKMTGTHYHVREINFTDFHDFKTLSAEMESNFTVDKNGDDVTWNDIRVLQVKKDHKYILFYKTDFESYDFKTINLRRYRRGRPLSESFSLTHAYITWPCISSEKKDLLSLCCDGIISHVYPSFINLCQLVRRKEATFPMRTLLNVKASILFWGCDMLMSEERQRVFRKATAMDLELKAIVAIYYKGWPHSSKVTVECKPYYSLKDDLYVQD
ncbi:hypothetical protein PR048_012671 [Dryococelus australis]|uniref:Uncharacterized protein n=1 Tax=Dryococelus australis TaxID=614101 RepID=A0ABQ9HQA1_9NEOP|nr:hypothetical protein PR048_012671 [Dryococelus australis]